MEENKKKNRIKFHIIAIFFIIIFCISIAPKYLQNDTFYTIKVGEYISQNGIGNLRMDPFSWHELPYTFPHWLYDLIIYTIYSIGGMAGIYGSTMFFTAILGCSIYLTSNKISKNAPISLIITLVAMNLMKPYLAARAQLVTFSLMTLTIFLIEKYLEKPDKKHAALLILMSLAIVNLHMAVWPFFFVLFIPYIVEYFISKNIITIDLVLKIKIKLERIWKKDNYEKRILELEEKIKHNEIKRKEIREHPYKIRVTINDNMKKLILVMIVCMFMGAITPTGMTTPYTYLYKTVTGNTMKVINEHLPLDLSLNMDFVAFFLFFNILLTFIDIKIDLKHLCYYLGILHLSLNARRQVSMFLVICTPILVKMIADIFERYAPELQDKLINFVNNFFAKVILSTAVILIAIVNFKPKINEAYYSNDDYPIYASQWIKENLDYKNIHLFNEYNYGSYLLYQGIPVMIDSRCDLYTPQYNTKTGNPRDGQDIFMDVQNVATNSADYKEIFEKYGITHIITYSDSNLSKKLKNDSDYIKLYPLTVEEQQKDDRFLVYEKVLENEE